jgi:hypothetical protein
MDASARPTTAPQPGAADDVEHLWSRAGATSGNRSQMRRPRQRLKQADPQPVATHGNGFGAHGKEGVDGSSPSEGSAKPPQNAGSCVQIHLHELQCAAGMEPFMELTGPERAFLGAALGAVALGPAWWGDGFALVTLVKSVHGCMPARCFGSAVDLLSSNEARRSRNRGRPRGPRLAAPSSVAAAGGSPAAGTSG